MSDCSPGPSSATLLTPEREQHQRIDLSLSFFCQREKDSTGKSRLASTEAGRACVIETSNLLQDGKISDLSDNDLNSIQYHARTCHSSYKKKGERYKKEQLKTSQKRATDTPISSPLSSPTCRPKRSKPLKTSDPKNKPCIVCDQMKCKGETERHRISEADLASNFLKATLFNKDAVYIRTIFLKTVPDVFKEDVIYHDKCLKRYIRKFQRDVDNLMKQTYDEIEPDKLGEVFKALVDSIDISKQGYALSDLRDSVNKQLEVHGK